MLLAPFMRIDCLILYCACVRAFLIRGWGKQRLVLDLDLGGVLPPDSPPGGS